MDIATWVQFLDEGVNISLSAESHGKSMNPSILLPVMSK